MNNKRFNSDISSAPANVKRFCDRKRVLRSFQRHLKRKCGKKHRWADYLAQRPNLRAAYEGSKRSLEASREVLLRDLARGRYLICDIENAVEGADRDVFSTRAFQESVAQFEIEFQQSADEIRANYESQIESERSYYESSIDALHAQIDIQDSLNFKLNEFNSELCDEVIELSQQLVSVLNTEQDLRMVPSAYYSRIESENRSLWRKLAHVERELAEIKLRVGETYKPTYLAKPGAKWPSRSSKTGKVVDSNFSGFYTLEGDMIFGDRESWLLTHTERGYPREVVRRPQVEPEDDLKQPLNYSVVTPEPSQLAMDLVSVLNRAGVRLPSLRVTIDDSLQEYPVDVEGDDQAE